MCECLVLCAAAAMSQPLATAAWTVELQLLLACVQPSRLCVGTRCRPQQRWARPDGFPVKDQQHTVTKLPGTGVLCRCHQGPHRRVYSACLTSLPLYQVAATAVKACTAIQDDLSDGLSRMVLLLKLHLSCQTVSEGSPKGCAPDNLQKRPGTGSLPG